MPCCSELAAFHAKKSKSPDHACFATYLVSGEVLDGRRGGGKGKGSDGDVDMDVDYGFTPTPTPNYGFAGTGKEEDGEDGEVVVQARMTVVGEDGLEGMYMCVVLGVWFTLNWVSAVWQMLRRSMLK